MLVVLLVASVIGLWVSVGLWLSGDAIVAVDFVSAYLPAARDVVDGTSPFPPPGDASLDAGSAYVYPPTLAVVLAPLSVLPQALAVGLWVGFLVAALAGALALCGVRDWRCYAAVGLWAPTASAIHTGNLSIVIALLAAVAWRSRTGFGGSVAVGLALALKLALAPLLAWQWSVRGARASLVPLAVACGVVAGAWAAVAFAGLGDYLSITREITRLEAPEAYSLEGLTTSLGLPSPGARMLGLALAVILIASSVRSGRRGDDERSFVLALFASLAVMPILWLHGFVLLAVALAVVRPSFGLVWLLPVLTWLAPVTEGSKLQVARVLVVTAAVLAVCLLSPKRRYRMVQGHPAESGT